ncbi:MAG: VOC family protein, partial [Spirochaetales bacterium]|nr:VOC family protein [Spirochaetales bacterium]
IDKRGEGMHHISYQVDDIEAQIADLKEKGIRMIDETPRGGAHRSRIAFIHPKSSAKVLTELTQIG